MTGYIGVNLIELLNGIGEQDTRSLLSDFSCPLNEDVEHFLLHNSIEFAKQGISSTFLVFASYKEQYVLAGYYALANKVFCISKKCLSSQWRKRFSRFGQFNKDIERYTLSAPLIGQLGKNYSHGYDRLISGDELLKLALDKVKEMQLIVGGKIVYLECEDIPSLTSFYSSNGFVNFGSRPLDKDEIGYGKNKDLIQMLRYMK